MKQDRLEKKEYLKNLKHAQKSLVKLAKEYAPFDFQYTLDLFIQGIYSMREYYAKGYCVMADDSQDPLTRLQMCDEILAAYVDFIECIDPFVEKELWNNLCDKIKAHFLYLWD